MSATLRKGWCPGALRPMAAKDGLLVRLRVTGGILPAATAHALADLAARHGNGLFDLSARANLQMRGVREAGLPALHDGLQALGLLDTSAAGESVRNVVASPLAGLHEGLDIRPVVAALERRLVEDVALHALPGKFGFLIDDGSWPSLEDVGADVRFDWSETDRRFAVSVGGTRDEAVPIGDCGGHDDVANRAAEIARAFLMIAEQRPETRRMRHLTAAPGPEAVAEACGRCPSPACGRRACPGLDPGWPDEVGSDEGTRHLSRPKAINGNVPHPTSADAEATFSRKREKDYPRDFVGFRTFSDFGLGDATPLSLVGRGRKRESFSCIGLAAPFGRLDAGMLHAAAAVAETTSLAELRLTPWRAILIPGAEHASALPGFITDPADPRLTVAACVGARGCARGTTDTHADAAALANALPPGEGIVLHVSGCEKGCAKPSTTPVTLVARDGRYDLVRHGRAGDSPERRGLDLAAARAALADRLETA